MYTKRSKTQKKQINKEQWYFLAMTIGTWFSTWWSVYKWPCIQWQAINKWFMKSRKISNSNITLNWSLVDSVEKSINQRFIHLRIMRRMPLIIFESNLILIMRIISWVLGLIGLWLRWCLDKSPQWHHWLRRGKVDHFFIIQQMENIC